MNPVPSFEVASDCIKVVENTFSIPVNTAGREPAKPRTATKVYRQSRDVTRLRPLLHIRRMAILLLSLVCRTWVPFVLLGLFSRCTRGFASVFFCYAGNKRYADHYGYASCRKVLRWFPSVIGVFKQGGEWGLICASPVTEAEFMSPVNVKNVKCLLRRLQTIRQITGARQLSLAGVLPSFLQRSGERPNATSYTDHTPEAVCQAIHRVRKQHFGTIPHRIVLLGGAGRIGKLVRDHLANDGIETTVLDISVGPTAELQTGAVAEPILLVDMSRKHAIERYIQHLPSGSVVLNEVFPEPCQSVVDSIQARNASAIHIAGVEARVFPPLPLGYKGALPCCAIHAPGSTELILVQLA